jgi:cytochrome oxidase assembly protein ShyY1
VSADASRRALFIPGAVFATALAALLALGFWQLERKAWKEDLIATIDQRLRAVPSAVPARERWPDLAQQADEFRRVSLRARFLSGTEARVYSGGAALRDDVKGPGYFAFAAAQLEDGSLVVVNRGFVANPNPDASLKPLGLGDAPLDLVGVLRWPEPARFFVEAYSGRQDLWFVRDHRAMAARYGWGEVAPFYVEMESPGPPGGVPKPAPLAVNLRNDHFNYAMTWFGLAAVLAIAFGFWVRSRRREA